MIYSKGLFIYLKNQTLANCEKIKKLNFSMLRFFSELEYKKKCREYSLISKNKIFVHIIDRIFQIFKILLTILKILILLLIVKLILAPIIKIKIRFRI